MTVTASALRTHEVRPPSARAETWMVARATFHIALWSALVVSAETYDGGRPSAAAVSAPSPFERRMQELAPEDQRLYRALREGMVEAERRRSATGRWPTPDELAPEAVPPFAADPLDRARYAWTFARSGTAANYVGTPAPGSGRETFVAIMAEPDPGTLPDPGAQVDEVHHRLADGTMIHATVWMGPERSPLREVVTVLAPDQGYKQVLGGR